MLRPSYSDLIKAVNSDVEPGEDPVVNSRYSIVIATAKRAKQLINGAKPLIETDSRKPLSIAIEEMCKGKVKIIADDEKKIEF